ncbi:MAG TPA: outer membrane beta-barrel protein [Bacteroidia bacterium]|jgi:hypothetical protein
MLKQIKTLKKISFVTAFLISSNMWSQEIIKDQTSGGFHRLRLGFSISPDFCFRKLETVVYRDNPTMPVLNRIEIPRAGYTAGINTEYSFNEIIGLQLGFYYSDKGYQTQMEDMHFGAIDPRRDFYYSPDGKVPVRGKFVYHYHYLDIPVKVNFILGKKKVRFIASTGAAANLFLKETTTSVVEYEDGSKKRYRRGSSFNYNKLNISPQVSAGIDWKIGDKSSLRIEPTFRYGILQIIDAPVTEYLWNAGLNIGYYFGVR